MFIIYIVAAQDANDFSRAVELDKEALVEVLWLHALVGACRRGKEAETCLLELGLGLRHGGGLVGGWWEIGGGWRWW